jgi:hypothetical protein
MKQSFERSIISLAIVPAIAAYPALWEVVDHITTLD